MPQFYRKKTPGQADSFYEVGTNRYIGPTEFGKGGFTEVAAPTNVAAVDPSKPKTTSTNVADNPVIKYIQETVNKPARERFEQSLVERQNLPKSADILSSTRSELGIPTLESSKAAVDKKASELNKLLQQIEDDLLSAQSGVEGQGRGITTGLVRGQQAKLARETEFKKLPLARSLQALTEESRLTGQEIGQKEQFASRLAEARLSDATRPFELSEARRQFEEGQAGTVNQAALKLLEEQLKPPKERETMTVTADGRTKLIDRLTGEVIKDLGSAYKATGGGGGGNTPITPDSDIELTNSQKQELRALGAQNFPPDLQLILLKTLSKDERNAFIKAWNAEQDKRKQSIDPSLFLEIWAAQQDGGSSSSSSSSSSSDDGDLF